MLNAMKMTLLAAGIAALSGCAGDIKTAPVTKQMSVNGDLEDVYYKLTAGAPSDSECVKWIVRSAIYPKKEEFRIEYGPQTMTGPQVFTSIVGHKNGGVVDLTMRDATWIKNSPYIKAVTNYLNTGVCE